MERRRSPRKLLDPIHVVDIETIERPVIIARYGTLRDASASGFLIHIKRRDLNPDLLAYDQALAVLAGKDITMQIVEMNLKIDAQIVHIRHLDGALCEIAVDFAKMAPDYWCECLAELLPNVGETEQIDPLANRRS